MRKFFQKYSTPNSNNVVSNANNGVNNIASENSVKDVMAPDIYINKELLFKELTREERETFIREVSTIIRRDNLRRPKIFISYAWPNERYPHYETEKDIQPWLLQLHDCLNALDAVVYLDIKTMTLGTNIDHFMQQGVSNCDVVFMIGTQTYHTRSQEKTNVQREIEHIQAKLLQKGSDCVIPILYRGEFGNALPNLGQLLGTDCHTEFLYQKNLPILIESLFKLQNHVGYQIVKRNYLEKLRSVENNGLSDHAILEFTQNRAQKARDAQAMEHETVNLMVERNAQGHPDYVPRPVGEESSSVKMLSSLKKKYSQYTHIRSLFGDPMPLEGQYINVQMLYQVVEKKTEENKEVGTKEDKAEKKGTEQNQEVKDARLTSYESIFGDKKPIAINQLFLPANDLLTAHYTTNEKQPDLAPNFILLQGRAGIGKSTFVNFVVREWAMGRLWQEYNWVFSLRLRDLRNSVFQQAYERNETWRLSDWIYEIHFASQVDKNTFQALWTWLIEPDLKATKVLFVLDGYDETPDKHPCEQALSDLFNSNIPKILTSRPYGLSDLPDDKRGLEIIGFIDENVDKYISLYFKHNQDKANTIIKELRTSPTLWGCAHIPVSLNIICGLLEAENNIPSTLSKLNTMSALYETMEISLLERAYLKVSGKEMEHAARLKPLDRDRKLQLLSNYYEKHRQYLGKLAFVAFSKQQLILTPKDVNDVLQSFNIPVGDFAEKINALLELGLLKKVLDEVTREETNYEFLHLTFQEYYAGHYLLWSVEHGSQALINDFAKVKLDPRYQIVLWFVAGTIKDKEKFDLFMRALAAPQGGDMLGNVQLSLLVRCTEENWDLAQQTGWTKAITHMLQKRIYGLWVRFKPSKYDYSDNADRSLPLPVWVQMLKISASGYKEQEGGLDLFSDVLTLKTTLLFDKQMRLIQFIRWLKLSTPAISNALTKLYLEELKLTGKIDELLEDFSGFFMTPTARLYQRQNIMRRIQNQIEDRELRNSQFHIICAMQVGLVLGTVETKNNLLVKLIPVLTDVNTNVDNVPKECSAALGCSLIALNLAIVNPAFVTAFSKLLIHNNQDIHTEARRVLSKCKTAPAIPELLTILVQLLKNEDVNVRLRACRTIATLGSVAMRADILTALNSMLTDGNDDIVQAAVFTISKLGSATPESLNIFETLTHSLTNKNEDFLKQVIIDLINIFELNEITANFAMKKYLLAVINQLLTLEIKGIEEQSVIDMLVGTAACYLGTDASTKNILVSIARLLTNKEENARYVAMAAVMNIGMTAATKDILAALAVLLANKNPDLRAAATQVVIKLGGAAATHDFMASLKLLLVDENSGVRATAAKVMAALVEVSATKDILAALTMPLHDINEDVRITAVEAVRLLGGAAATNDFLITVAKMLTDQNIKIRATAIKVITALGGAAATSDFLITLKQLLTDKDDRIREIALEAVYVLGDAAATKEFLTALAQILTNKDKDIRSTAVKVVSVLGAAAATNDFLKSLAQILMSKDNDVRITVVEAVSVMGKVAATDDFLIPLIQMLADKDTHVRATAVTAVKKFGTAAAINNFLIVLKKLLVDKDALIRTSAFAALGGLGDAAATNDFLIILQEGLADQDENVRLAAIDAVGNIGTLAATDTILARLNRLLSNGSMREYMGATYTITQLGVAAGRSDILHSLGNLLKNSNDSCRDIIVALRSMGTTAATNEILNVLATKMEKDRDTCSSFLFGLNINTNKFDSAAVRADILLPLMKFILSENYDTDERITSILPRDTFLTAFIRLLLIDNYFTEKLLPGLLNSYVRTNSSITLKENAFFPAAATALIVGAYLLGMASFSISYEPTTLYQLRGFIDKMPFNISLSHSQAQWFIYWSPQIIHSLNDGTFTKKFVEIEQTGMSAKQQKNLAWFDQQSSSSSSSTSASPSLEQKKLYGLSDDTIISSKLSPKNCLLM